MIVRAKSQQRSAKLVDIRRTTGVRNFSPTIARADHARQPDRQRAVFARPRPERVEQDRFGARAQRADARALGFIQDRGAAT
jgi:hypothetical protein